jgi:hypothetical protein
VAPKRYHEDGPAVEFAGGTPTNLFKRNNFYASIRHTLYSYFNQINIQFSKP